MIPKKLLHCYTLVNSVTLAVLILPYLKTITTDLKYYVASNQSSADSCPSIPTLKFYPPVSSKTDRSWVKKQGLSIGNIEILPTYTKVESNIKSYLQPRVL